MFSGFHPFFLQTNFCRNKIFLVNLIKSILTSFCYTTIALRPFHGSNSQTLPAYNAMQLHLKRAEAPLRGFLGILQIFFQETEPLILFKFSHFAPYEYF